MLYLIRCRTRCASAGESSRIGGNQEPRQSEEGAIGGWRNMIVFPFEAEEHEELTLDSATLPYTVENRK
jgi:hypothetical protein